MTIPILAPRPGRLLASNALKLQPVLTHSDLEWAALFPEIERLYIRERRKLRYVMQLMESEHGFKATEQMYKKRFAKWGFQKYSKRSAAVVRPLKTKDLCRRVASRKASPSGELASMPAFPGICHRDALTLTFLTSVQTWSVAFFESSQLGDGFLASQQQPLLPGQPQPSTTREINSNTRKINFAFKLAIDLLGRGHGDLAGRMARKAFLLVEDMLTLEAPALVWNLLEIMHHMMMLRHVQLFHILLTHLTALADVQMPETHPLHAMLRGLRGLVASLNRAASSPSGSSPSSSSLPSSSTGSNESMTSTNTWPLSQVLSSLLQQAWILNAKILFHHFDPRLFQLYFHILWDSCSIEPPADIISAADQMVSQIDAKHMISAKAVAYPADVPLASTSVDEKRMIQHLLAPRVDSCPPRDYEMLRVSNVAALRERGDAILSMGYSFNGDTTLLLRILAALATVKVFEALPTVVEWSSAAYFATTKVPRFHASIVACVIRTLVDLDTEHGGGEIGVSLDTVERIRAIVALCGYAEGETDPQVMREMWLLRDALVAAGEYVEARNVERDVNRRIEMYIHDIAVYSALMSQPVLEEICVALESTMAGKRRVWKLEKGLLYVARHDASIRKD